MTGLLSALLLVPIRLCLRLQSLCYWALVYSTAGLTATLVLTRITWRGLRAPRHVFRWTMRQQPPACLRDPVLGEHSYLRGMLYIVVQEVTTAVVFLCLPALNRTFKPHPQSASHLPILSDTVRLSISPLPVPFHPASQLVRSLMTGRWVGIQNRARRLTEQELEAYLYQLSQPGGLAGPLSYYRSLCSDTPLRHQDVGVACLLLWGEADAFLGPGLARASRAYMRGSCAVRIVPGCSHWVQQDQPEAVNGLIWAFLREGGRGGSTRNNH
nr:PREDICTED: epoxide hydrolase 4-like [Lepisosteus oculatus]